MARKPANPVLIKLDVIARPLYEAMGLALTRWQFVETGMFILTHAIMQTDYKYSSRAFFRLKGADAKLQLLDELCEAHFDASVIKTDWQPLRKHLRESIKFRNTLAHFEISYITNPAKVPPGNPPVVLTPQHTDDKSFDKSAVKAVNIMEINQMAENYRILSDDLISLVSKRFSLEKLRATHLPPRWLQFLSTGQTPSEEPPPQPKLGSAIAASGLFSASGLSTMAHQKSA